MLENEEALCISRLSEIKNVELAVHGEHATKTLSQTNVCQEQIMSHMAEYGTESAKI